MCRTRVGCQGETGGVYACLSVCLSVFLSICLAAVLDIYLSVRLNFCVAVCMLAFLSACPSESVWTLYACISVFCPPARRSACPYVRLSGYRSVSIMSLSVLHICQTVCMQIHVSPMSSVCPFNFVGYPNMRPLNSFVVCILLNT